MIGIGLGGTGGGVAHVDPQIRDVLNTDPSNIIGITYQWDDTIAWVDINIWKD
jgi:hypothetical protein